MSANAWMMPAEVFDWLGRRLTAEDVVVELGSGEGTARLANITDAVVTIEHDPQYLLESDDCITSVHAPIVGGWYDRDRVKAALPDRYTCVIVDGPPGTIGRHGLLENLDLFADVPFLFDDTHRQPERELAFRVAAVRGKNISIHCMQNGRSFATVGWEPL